MEQSEIGKTLAAAVDAIDKALDDFADGFNKDVVPQIKILIERLSKIEWSKLR